MNIDSRPDLALLVGLGSLLYDIEHDSAAAEAHELSDETTRVLALA